MVTVLDALGEERCILLRGPAQPAVVFAATYPARTAGLALFNPTARARSDTGYAGLDEEQVEQRLAMIEREWGTGVTGRVFGLGGDERLQRWHGKCERLMYSPGEAARLYRSVLDTDVRDVLPTISVPTLVVAHQRSPLLSQSRHLAEHIAGARYIEVPGGDYLTATDDLVDAVEEFVTGPYRRPPSTECSPPFCSPTSWTRQPRRPRRVIGCGGANWTSTTPWCVAS
jgi:pimeloyl-ACP methyl ester carboxylesterase